jgi:predicted nucleotidyltransferase
MNFGLDDKVVDNINSIFKKYKNIDRVVLYGSRAKGNYKDGSDIDLTIFGTDLKLIDQHKIESQIDDLLLPYSIDLSIYADISNQELLDHIDRVGKIFYRKI